MPIPPVPEPERVYAYLVTHGWIPESPEPDDGVMFTFHEPDDFGEPITVFLPLSSEVVFYPLRIHDVVVTAAGMEDRSQDAVRADMLATPLPQVTPIRIKAPDDDPVPAAAETPARKGA